MSRPDTLDSLVSNSSSILSWHAKKIFIFLSLHEYSKLYIFFKGIKLITNLIHCEVLSNTCKTCNGKNIQQIIR